MSSDPVPREQEGSSHWDDAPDAVDPGSALSALEDLLGCVPEECSARELDEFCSLIAAARDRYAEGRIDEGSVELRSLEQRIEDLREEGTMSRVTAGRVLSLIEAAIAWADDQPPGSAVEESPRFGLYSGESDEYLP